MIIYRYWVCEDPDRYWDGREYDHGRTAVQSAKLHANLHVVEVKFEMADTDLVYSPNEEEGNDEQS